MGPDEDRRPLTFDPAGGNRPGSVQDPHHGTQATRRTTTEAIPIATGVGAMLTGARAPLEAADMAGKADPVAERRTERGRQAAGKPVHGPADV